MPITEQRGIARCSLYDKADLDALREAQAWIKDHPGYVLRIELHGAYGTISVTASEWYGPTKINVLGSHLHIALRRVLTAIASRV